MEPEFGPVDEPTFFDHFVWYFLQLIASVPGVMIASLPFWLVLSVFGLSSAHQPHRFAGYEALASLFVGVLAGWWMARREPQLISSGRWIWLAPAIVILPDIIRAQLHPTGFPWLPEYLFASRAEGIGAFLLKSACSAAGYSIGMVLAGRLPKAKMDRPAMQIGGAVLSVVALFALCALAVHELERRSLAHWARFQSVIDRDGLPLAPEPALLCGPHQGLSIRFRVLPVGTRVETLERRACIGNQIVAPDNVPPPNPELSGPYYVDRVRIINVPGRVEGAIEGWVLEYGLGEP